MSFPNLSSCQRDPRREYVTFRADLPTSPASSGDVAMLPTDAVLDYGWQSVVGEMTCHSEETGMTCSDAAEFTGFSELAHLCTTAMPARRCIRYVTSGDPSVERSIRNTRRASLGRLSSR